MVKKEDLVVVAYNEISGRKIRVLPSEVRVRKALQTFTVDEFRNTFLWALNDPWCAQNNILKERVAWVCSYDVVAQHSDYEPPKSAESWA